MIVLQEPDPPLHEAAKAGDADKVKSLLDGGADPCQADSRGKVPYDVAADKPVRDAFRRSASGCLCSCSVPDFARCITASVLGHIQAESLCRSCK